MVLSKARPLSEHGENSSYRERHQFISPSLRCRQRPGTTKSQLNGIALGCMSDCPTSCTQRSRKKYKHTSTRTSIYCRPSRILWTEKSLCEWTNFTRKLIARYLPVRRSLITGRRDINGINGGSRAWRCSFRQKGRVALYLRILDECKSIYWLT